ncbi:hypothetical protein NPIL_223271 [Nephila pilipes]|uniref:Uncharacterized protein n=1 Tax=Nephila pilipes TaxID=299642 RepID=A0A8X6MIX2_NEPPI|nr:hypothetical protein NPIL_223271 [Nephila pilipes]
MSIIFDSRSGKTFIIAHSSKHSRKEHLEISNTPKRSQILLYPLAVVIFSSFHPVSYDGANDWTNISGCRHNYWALETGAIMSSLYSIKRLERNIRFSSFGVYRLVCLLVFPLGLVEEFEELIKDENFTRKVNEDKAWA